MAVTPLPFLDRTSATFKNDTDTFFGSQLPTFSVEVNQVATDAQASATAANNSKTAAATSATNAGTSATNAANSATAANTSKTNAATSETNAANSATAANNSKTAAATSATNAATSATNSEASAVRAKQAADSISSGPVTSVNSKTGVVSLSKGDIGLSLVDNLSIIARGMSAGGVLATLSSIDDYVNLTNGWYGVRDTATGARPPGESWGTLLVAGRAFQSDARVDQLFFGESSTRVWLRRNTGGTWSPWRELTRPIPGSVGVRKPLVGSADGVNDEWSNILSIANYLDKSLTGTAAAAQTLDVGAYSIFDFLLAAATTFSFANLPSLAGETITVVVRVRQDSSTVRTISWPSNITWLTPQGVAPQTPVLGQIVEYIFSTVGSPANWYGRVGAST